MGYSYKQAIDLFGVEVADNLFERAGVSKGRVKMSDEEKREKSYIKMTEEAHGKILHKRLDQKNIFHTHFGNESGQSGSKNIIIMMAKKKSLGVRKGFPDYYIAIPTKDSYVNLYIELKKAAGKQGGWNGSSFNIEQAECLTTLANIPFTWCALSQGSEKAITLIDDMIDSLKDKSVEEILQLWYNREQVNFVEHVNR